MRATLPWLCCLLVALVAPFLLPGGFGLTLLCRMAIAIVFALSFNMLLGQGGMLDFGHAVFLGFGGYTAMHLMRAAGNGWWVPAPLLPLGGALGGLVTAIVAGSIATRRGETAFAMITLGLAELFATVVLMFPSVFGGEEGIDGDRSNGPKLLGIDFGSQFHVYFLIAAWAFVCAWLMWRYTATPLGRLACAVRDNPLRVGFIGYDPARVRFLVFVLSGLFAGVAGGLQALNDEIATSTNISASASGAVLVMTFIGGTGTFWGPVLGAVLVTVLQQALSTVTEAWQLYDGLLFMAAVVWAPGGLSGIILAHAPLVRGGRAKALTPSYLAVVPGLALAMAGIVALAELAYRLQSMRNGLTPAPLFGLTAHPEAPWQWLVGVVLFAAGAALLRRTWPRARACWQATIVAPA
ncbi:branched-chain amino acid ABC transporter permease [Lichenicoccus sp.]|uniref:branched-chain amino acid ABC transporter permease n=1 Tax=Lichenicoccus sp. TaxID=2781899 RepID=UPI003D0A624E